MLVGNHNLQYIRRLTKEGRAGPMINKSGNSEGRSSNRGNTSRNKYRQEFSGDHVFDYKDPQSLARFVSDGGKITPARIAKLSIAQQKQAAKAVKRARSLALLPSGSDAHDTFNRSEVVSPVPFEV